MPNQDGAEAIPEGALVGLGVRTIGIRNLHVQGELAQTSNPLDVAINGRGWFQVTSPTGETLYTRAGSFNRSATGQLVTADGYTVNPAMTLPTNASSIVINESGQVYAQVSNQVAPQLLGQLQMSTFANDSGLEPLGDNLYRETTSSGQPVEGVAGDIGFGRIVQGYLESSNVDPVKEITSLIAAQRAYEMNSKVIQAADDMSKIVSTGIR